MELRLTEVFNSIRSVQAQSSEPLCAYVYDLEGLRRHAVRVVASLPSACALFYAIKANSDLPILQTLAPLVHGFKVSSGGKLAWVRTHFPDFPVIFSGPGKLDSELEAALEHRVDALHIESFNESQRKGGAGGTVAHQSGAGRFGRHRFDDGRQAGAVRHSGRAAGGMPGMVAPAS